MHRIVSRLRTHRDRMSLQRAIDEAGTPAMREELIAIAQRHISS